MRRFSPFLAMASLAGRHARSERIGGACSADVRAAMRADAPTVMSRDDRSHRLTEQLERRGIEHLQAEGAGPETMGRARPARSGRAIWQAGTGAELFDAPSSPSAEDQSRVLEKPARSALQYNRGLPNFLCRDGTPLRAGKRSAAWKVRDTLTLALGYSEKGEHTSWSRSTAAGLPETERRRA